MSDEQFERFEEHLRELHAGGWDRVGSVPGRNADAEFNHWLVAHDAQVARVALDGLAVAYLDAGRLDDRDGYTQEAGAWRDAAAIAYRYRDRNYPEGTK